MPSRSGAVHVATTTRRYKGKTYTSHLLRRSFRVGQQVQHETLGNLSHLPDSLIDIIRRSLAGESFVPAAEAFRVERSRPHGHVEAVLGALRQLGLDRLLASKPSRQRDLVVAMIVERLLHPGSKLATTRLWQHSTLAQQLGVEDADENDLYGALDWLLARQKRIENKLAERHLSAGDTVLYDVSSSYYEGRHCPLAKFGHSRDRKKGQPIIVYGVLADSQGRPLAVSVYPGNTGDPATLPDQVDTLRRRFGLRRVVLVGDRGLWTQTQIENLRQHRGLGWNKLAERHLSAGDTVLYDVSSSYYEGRHCPLAKFGHSRDRKKGQPIIVYGVLADSQGRPLAVSVYPGNTGDPATLPDQVDTLRRRFGLRRVVLVGDRGLWTQTQIENLRQHRGLGWISALRAPALRRLADGGQLQLSLFDKKNLAEIHSPDYPGERLVACYNPLLAEQRGRKRDELLAATEKEFERIEAEVARRKRTPLASAEIGRKAGRVLDRYKMGKHYETTIDEGVFHWERREAAIQREAELDGIYVIRTSEDKADLKAEDAVRSYKSLARVERVFRCMKGADLRVRPIFHRTPDHVRAHIFLCLLA